jgi:vacuole membrane protein 1
MTKHKAVKKTKS